MRYQPVSYTSYAPAPPTTYSHRPEPHFDEKPPRRSDWLLIMVTVLFVLTLSIVWYVSASV